MNLAQALKKKARLEKKANDLLTKINKSNKVNVLNTAQQHDVMGLITEWNEIINDIVEVKAKISENTVLVAKVIAKQGLLRKLLNTLRELDCNATSTRDRYSSVDDAVQSYKVQLSPTQRDLLVEQTQKQIDDLQDQLDDYNAVTKL